MQDESRRTTVYGESNPAPRRRLKNRPATRQAPEANVPDEEQIRAFRKRLKELIAFLDKAFGPLTEKNSHLWERRAYLLVVGLLHDRLTTSEAGLTTEELTALTKVLAEGRHIRDAGRADTETTTPPRKPGIGRRRDPIPDPMARAVREVYGVSAADSNS
jgi:hypothetical protein